MVKEGKMYFKQMGLGNKVGITIISDKLHFKPKLFRRNKEAHFILTKETAIKKTV